LEFNFVLLQEIEYSYIIVLILCTSRCCRWNYIMATPPVRQPEAPRRIGDVHKTSTDLWEAQPTFRLCQYINRWILYQSCYIYNCTVLFIQYNEIQLDTWKVVFVLTKIAITVQVLPGYFGILLYETLQYGLSK